MQDFQQIKAVFDEQKKFFSGHNTRDVNFIKQQLNQLKAAIVKFQPQIEAALLEDLGKTPEIVQKVEIDVVVHEIDYALAHLDAWYAENKKPIDLPAELKDEKGYVVREPYGVTYIIGPFNYPINLTFAPLVGAIVGGNTAIIKPSENVPNTSSVIKAIIDDAFPAHYIKVFEGAVEENTYLLSLPFDFIFFTGSPGVGKIVMQAASKHLIPVILELGGKTPFIVEKSADIKQAVEQLLFGKLINSGQTCISPDYVYIDKSVEAEFLQQLTDALSKSHMELGSIGKIVTSSQVERVASWVKNTHGKVLIGGDYDKEKRYFQPTVVSEVSFDDSLMQQELFAPIIPVVTFDDIAEVPVNVNKYTPKPLAVYVFTKDEQLGLDIINKIPAGDAEINAVFGHATSSYYPFGGVGSSGMGEYHGVYSFEAFTHRKSIRIIK